MKNKIIIPRHAHLDANTIPYFSRELEFISKENFDPQRTPLKVMTLVPMDTSVDPNAERWTRRSYDSLGEAAIIKSYSKAGFPTVAEKAEEESVKFIDVGDKFIYTVDELNRAAQVGRPLDRDRARIARQVVDRKLENLIAAGDTASNLVGFLSVSGTNTYTVPTGGGGSKLTELKTPSENLADLNGILNKAAESTEEIENSTRIVMDPISYRYLAQTPYNATSSVTIIEFFTKMNPGVEVMTWQRLKTAAAGGGRKWVAYDPNPLKLRCILSIPFQQMAPELDGMEYSVLCRSRLAGLDVPFPKSMTYASFE